MKWAPPWAPHASGEHEPVQQDEDGKIVPVDLILTCAICKDETRWVCDSGQPRTRICLYARGHVHRDPFEEKKP